MRLGLVIFALLFFAASCAKDAARQTPNPHAGTDGRSARDGVQSIQLPRYQIDLPAGPGRDAFAVACLSCHSQRYVAMQPSFSQAKWDEIVRKMIKTYGAPIAEQDVPVIVQYLVATKETENSPAWRALPQATINASSPPLDIEPSTDSTVRIRDAARGAALYAQSCASCHPVSGTLEPHLAASLTPRPSDLRTHRYSLHALTSAVWNGVSGTAMPGYRSLGREDLQAIVTFTAQQSAVQDTPSISGSDLFQARVLYAANCASCHGESGNGDGFAAAALARRPTDFTNVQPDEATAIQAIASGIAGTSMPRWSAKLSSDEQKLLAAFVRSLFAQ